jgi:hypothetical protein
MNGVISHTRCAAVHIPLCSSWLVHNVCYLDVRLVAVDAARHLAAHDVFVPGAPGSNRGHATSYAGVAHDNDIRRPGHVGALGADPA